MGFIYMIRCTKTGMIYIGQSVDPEERRKSHWSYGRKMIKYLADPENNDFSQKYSYLYRAMAKYGLDSFEFTVLIEVPDKELDDTEIAYIEKYESLHPKGYNLASGGGHFRHNDATKELMSQLAKEAAPSLIDKYRRPETKGLPMNIVLHRKGNARGYAICNHPLCSYKSFTEAKYGSDEAAKTAAVAFLAKLVEEGNPVDCTVKQDLDLPERVTRLKNGKGYNVRYFVNGMARSKSITDSKLTDAQKLEKALEFHRANNPQVIQQ